VTASGGGMVPVALRAPFTIPPPATSQRIGSLLAGHGLSNGAKAKADPIRGLFEATIRGTPSIVEYEPDSDLRDTEQVPLLEEGGIEAFIRREVLPYTPDAWIKEDASKIGYEVSFTRHFYQPPQLRTLAEISADILKLERETEGLLTEITKGVKA